MEFLKAFPIAIIDEDYESKEAAGIGMRQLAEAIEKEGFRVVAGVSYADAQRLVEVFNSESCWLVSIDGVEEGAHQWEILEGVLAAKRRRNDRLPLAPAPTTGQPTEWPRRSTQGDVEIPFVEPIVPAAAVDSSGGLWIALRAPFTYVYDGDGEKTRVVQFRGAGLITPTSLSFASGDRLLVTPGCYWFDTRPRAPERKAGADQTP